MSYLPIEQYGIIGDLETIALVGTNGSIDYFCFPEFDSPTVFCRILDDEKGGFFQIKPDNPDNREKQIYLSNSAVLFSRFLSSDGVAEISDFMPISDAEGDRALVRRVKVIRGEMNLQMTCQPAFDYARQDHTVEKRPDGLIFLPQGNNSRALFLRSNIPLELDETRKAGVAAFSLKAGETATFILEDASLGASSPYADPGYVALKFKETVNFWREWISQSSYKGRWREIVQRSAMTLKLLSSARYGSIAAAATFGLPEEIGGERNWDYRYTWIRDASFTVYALNRIGLTDELVDFMHWIHDRCNQPNLHMPLQTMYRLSGSSELDEIILEHLEGYKNSKPVRIGNAASNQLQLDIYGELIDSIYLFDKYQESISYELWNHIVEFLDWLKEHWDQPDEGIWEVRGGRKHFLYSRLMCWVAYDRAIRLARKRSLPGPTSEWIDIRDAIHQEIHTRFWNPEIGAFTQHLETNALDASSLLMPLVRFISPTDPRWLRHLHAIEDHLVYDSLVYRYDVDEAAEDGLSGEEGTFSMCSFWYVECLSRAGDLERARFYFEKMLGYANHLGLYAEELGIHGEHLGNTPQAFTHLALISAAFDLDKRLDRAGYPG